MRDGQTSSELESVDWHVLLGHLALSSPLHTHTAFNSLAIRLIARENTEKKKSVGRRGVFVSK